jgi:hypothetical protein
MRLRAIFNKRFGEWKLCHDQWCKPGETSVVAVITSTGNDKEDGEFARRLAERWNMVEDAAT